jgi:pantoate--beta-alanine ligase
MQIIRSIAKMQNIISALKKQGKSIGFVPTMGAFHEGHLSLMRRGRRENDILVVSIFVNPIQFGPREDYKKYPRPFSRDKKAAEKEKTDYIFAPTAQEMYPAGFLTKVKVEQLTAGLCGASRPGHFDGVTTVVAKLFNIVSPDRVYLGQKDYQQATIIKKMVDELNVPLKILVMPIIRETDGLAMSSRNQYLDAKERRAAVVLNRSLQMAQKIIKSNYKTSPQVLISKIKTEIKKEPLAIVDYVEIVDAPTLKEVQKLSGQFVIILAVYIGKTRLIDNVVVKGSRH